MRHLSSPGNRRANTKRTNLYKSAIRHKFAVGAVMAISGLAVVAATALPSLANVSAADNNTDNAPTQQTAPYGDGIVFIGDSLTAGVNYDNNGVAQTNNPPSDSEIKSLGSQYRAYNYGIGGSSIDNWLTNIDGAWSAPKEVLQSGKAKVVQIMLGTNDLWSSKTADDLVGEMKSLIAKLEKAGAEKVIINKVPFAKSHNASKVKQYNEKLSSLADGDVLVGDESAYAYTSDNKDTVFSDKDGTHLTPATYDKLGQFWAEAYKRVLLDPQTTNYAVTANGDTVSYSISKDSSWFKPATGYFSNILVDDQIVDQTNYVVTGDGSNTKIVLNSNYVKMLNKTAKHTITVRFNDGVNFSDEFELKTGDNTNNSNPGDNNNTGNQNQNANNDQTTSTTKPAVNGEVTIAAPNTGYRR